MRTKHGICLWGVAGLILVFFMRPGIAKAIDCSTVPAPYTDAECNINSNDVCTYDGINFVYDCLYFGGTNDLVWAVTNGADAVIWGTTYGYYFCCDFDTGPYPITITPGAGADTVAAHVVIGINTYDWEESTTVDLGAGNDTFIGSDETTGCGLPWCDDVDAGTGADTVHLGDGKDQATSPAGDTNNDSFYGQDGPDKLALGGGDDYAEGGNGNDLILGGPGDDELHGDAGDDTVYGGSDVDDVYGGADDDTVCGLAGDDNWISGDAGTDICAESGDTGYQTASCEDDRAVCP